VDVHGGAWKNGQRTNDAPIDIVLAPQGILTVAMDFRQPPEAGYPASVQDIIRTSMRRCQRCRVLARWRRAARQAWRPEE
jgi:acetyl esterase/lipase